MSSVLHPTGPEGPQTYWLRRIGVVVAALAVVLVVAWAWPKGGDEGEATPASDSSTVATPAEPSSPTTPASTASATPTATGKTPAPSASSTGRSTPKASATATSASAGTSPSASTTPTRTKIRECQADDLHVTLTGPRRVTIAKKTTLKLSVINGGDDTCRLSLDAKTFELKIYSGTDRIWSTHDCDTWMKPIKQHTLKSQQEVDWSQAWPAKRSHSGCKLADNLRPGTYVATAQLTLDGKKAAPVQLVMSLHR